MQGLNLVAANLAEVVGPSCEPLGEVGWLPGLAGWEQPGSAWSSLAFVVAGVVIITTARRRARVDWAPNADTLAVILGVMALGNGIGSLIQHGPAPTWNPVMHDPPLAGALAVVAADGIADLTQRRLRHSWWLAPTSVVTLLAAAAPAASAAAQSLLAVAAISVTLLRLRRWRRVDRAGVTADGRRACAPVAAVVAALALLAAGGVVGTLSRPGMPLCQPQSALFHLGLSGHCFWHLLSAGALVALAPVLGYRAASANSSVSSSARSVATSSAI